MDLHQVGIETLIGFGLFFASEAIGLSKLRSNTVLQMLLAAALRAYPYEPRRKPQGPLGGLLGRDREGRR
jgi:hypothetical protein